MFKRRTLTTSNVENASFVFAILRSQKRFYALRDFVQSSAADELERYARRRKERAEAPKPEEAPDTGGEIAGTVGDDRLGREVFAQPDDDLAEIDAARLRRRRLGPFQEIVVSGQGLGRPRQRRP